MIGSLFIVLVVLMVGGSMSAGDEKGEVFWKEDFSRFDVGTAGGCGKKCVIKEENGKKFLHGTGWMLGNISYYGARYWKNYSFRFKFRFTDPKKIWFIPFVKARGARDGFKYLWYYVNVRKDRVAFNCHGVKPKDIPKGRENKTTLFKNLGIPPLMVGKWYSFRIDVTHDEMRIYLFDNGEWVKISDSKVLPGDGGVGILSYSPLDAGDISVTRLKK